MRDLRVSGWQFDRSCGASERLGPTSLYVLALQKGHPA
jgi:hypothetical protein